MNDDEKPATRGDVKEIVTEVVTAVVTKSQKEILGAVGDQFITLSDDIEERFDSLDVTTARIENKLDATADKVDGHTADISGLQQKVV